MTTTRHVAHAIAGTSADEPHWRVEVRAGTHRLVADESAVGGGADAGVSPFGLLCSSLAACTAMTLHMYAERKGWTVDSIEIDARYDVTDEASASIERTISLPANLAAEQRDRFAEIAERTPVTLALRAGTPITTTVVLRDDRPPSRSDL